MFILNAGSVNLSLRNRTNGWVSDWETKGFETKFEVLSSWDFRRWNGSKLTHIFIN
jgi:hypothetical protein